MARWQRMWTLSGAERARLRLQGSFMADHYVFVIARRDD
jgi:hypothetical protein